MIARLEANMASASDAHTGWTVAKEGENGIIFMANIVDFEALGGLMMNEDQVQWDKALWESEVEHQAVDHYHWINNTGLLSVEEIQAIGREVW